MWITQKNNYLCAQPIIKNGFVFYFLRLIKITAKLLPSFEKIIKMQIFDLSGYLIMYESELFFAFVVRVIRPFSL